MNKQQCSVGMMSHMRIATKFLLCLYFASTWGASTYAQTPLLNGDFETWTLTKGSGNFKDYEEPSNGWSSGNGVIHVAPNTNPVVTKSTDAVQGMYSAKLITQSIFGQIAAGSLFIGHFKLNLVDFAKSAVLGAPFTDKPVRFRGHYKYIPVKSDSATLYARLTKWSGSNQVVVGEAIVTEYNAVPGWTSFSIPFEYYSGVTPDSIRVVLASSAGGENFKGEMGSTLFVDAVELDYTPTSVQDYWPSTPNIGLRLRAGTLEIQQSTADKSVVRIVNACGVLVKELVVNSGFEYVDCTQFPTGVYVATVNGLTSALHTSATFAIIN